MDFLNQTFSQVSDLFRSMTPGARLTAGLLLVLVVVSLGYMFTQQVSGTDVYLMEGEPVPPGDLPAMEAAFAKAGLNDYEINGCRIRVPSAKKAEYMGALADAGALPENFHDSLEKVIEGGGAFESNFQKQQRINFAKQKELAMILEAMQGIQKASVLFDAETRHGLNASDVKTASVNVKPLGSTQLNSQQVQAIRHTVAAAYAGLSPENVTVTDLNGRTYPGGESGGMADAFNDPYATRKREWDSFWKEKVKEQLGMVPGVIVTADVELDRQMKQVTEKREFGTKPVIVESNEMSSSGNREGAAPAGRPGYQSNANNSMSLAGTSRGSSETSDESKTSTRGLADETLTSSEQVGLTPKIVRVAVSLPSSYIQQVWTQRNPTPEGEEPKTPDQAALDTILAEETTNIKNSVAAILPEAQGVASRTDLVTVSVFQNIPGEEIEEPGMSADAMVWLGQHWSMLGMFGVAMFSLVMLRSMVRGGGHSPTPAEGKGDEAGGEHEGDEDAAITLPINRLARFTGSGPTLRDELSELVHEDADAAANILKTWIGQTG